MEKRRKKVKDLTPQDIRVRERKRRKRKIISLFILSFVFFALLFLLFVYLVSLPRINIQEVKIEGVQAVSSEEISFVVFEELSNKSFGIFPNSSILFVSRKEIENKLRENFLRVRDANIEIENLQTLMVKIEERQPYAVWCRGPEDVSFFEDEVLEKPVAEKTQEECYFVDDTGFIFVRAPHFSSGVFLRFEGGLEDWSNQFSENEADPALFPLGRQVLESVLFADLLGFVEHLSIIDILVEKVHLSTGQEISLETGEASRILLDKKQDLELALINIFAIVDDEKFQDDVGNDFSNVDYIDMKIPDKVFYSIKGFD